MPRRSAWMVVLALLLAGCGTHARVAQLPEAPKPPNIVFILTDDLSWDLVNPRFTPHIVALERRGETFDLSRLRLTDTSVVNAAITSRRPDGAGAHVLGPACCSGGARAASAR